MTTKRQIIEDAYSAVGLASYAFDLTAEEIVAAQRALDAMMAQWNIRGLRVGYAMGGVADDESGLPDWTIEAVSTNLGIRLAGRIGKAVMPETKQAAREAYSTVLALCVKPIPALSREVPAGGGNRPWHRTGQPFIEQQSAPLMAGDDSELDLT